MSIIGRICNYYQPGYLNGQASWFSSGPPPPCHVKCLKEMVILLGVLFRSGPIQLKDFFLKLWFHSLEVVSLSRIRGLALFPNSWSPGPFAYQDYEYIKFYKCALAGRCQCWRGEINYKQRRLPFEKLVAWGMRHARPLPSWGLSHSL